MHALILAPSAPLETARARLPLADVAGCPVLARQIQWLHAIGCDEVVIESGGDPDVVDFVESVGRRYGPLIKVVHSDRGVSLEARLRSAEIPLRGPVFVLPSGVLGDGDLTRVIGACGTGGAIVRCAAPPVFGTRSGAIRIWMPGEHVAEVDGSGWAIALDTVSDAWALGWAAIDGSLEGTDDEPFAPIQIHGAEIAEGIFVARGARIDPEATVLAPVFVGAGAYVAAGATVGPNVVIGANAAVLGEARVRREHVAPRAIVGPGGRALSFAAHGSLARAFLRDGIAAIVRFAAIALD